jgi:hypothetical protein
MPSTLRMPVANISVRVWMGIQKMLVMPGNLRVLSISLSSSSQVTDLSSGHSPLSGGLSHAGAQDEYQRSTGTLRHASGGFKVTTVSTMLSGAGSVGLLDRPIFPKTVSTSEKP